MRSSQVRPWTKELSATVKKDGTLARERGDAVSAMAKAKTKHEALYTAPFLAHAPMEPPAATAKWSKDACEVWAPTQNPQSALGAIAGAIGMSQKKIRVNVNLLGRRIWSKEQVRLCRRSSADIEDARRHTSAFTVVTRG